MISALWVDHLGDHLRGHVQLVQAHAAGAGDVEEDAASRRGCSRRGAGWRSRPARPRRRGSRRSALPIAISAGPASCMIRRTSAKSRLMSPGIVISSEMPWMPCRRTSSAIMNDSSTVVFWSQTASSRSLGMTMSVSTSSRSAWMPCSALLAPLRALEAEWPRDDGHGERADVLGHLRDDRRGAGAGAAAHAGCDEHHVGVLERVLQLLAGLLGGRAPLVRVAAHAEALVSAGRRCGCASSASQRMSACASVLMPTNSTPPILACDHAVDGVAAASANADHLDRRQPVQFCFSHSFSFPFHDLSLVTSLPVCHLLYFGISVLIHFCAAAITPCSCISGILKGSLCPLPLWPLRSGLLRCPVQQADARGVGRAVQRVGEAVDAPRNARAHRHAQHQLRQLDDARAGWPYRRVRTSPAAIMSSKPARLTSM